MDYKGKVALITGGARGLGKAFSEALLERGCKVAVLGMRVPNGEAVVNAFNKQYGEGCAIFIKCDVSSDKEFEDAFKKALEWKGHINIVINNAGIMDETVWRKMVDINLCGVIIGTKLGFQYMGKDSGGQGGIIINVSSVAGLHPVFFIPVYSATKYGVVGLTRNFGIQQHYDKSGVEVVAICPGTAKSDLFPDKERMYFPEAATEFLKKIPFMQASYVADGLMQLLDDHKNGDVMEISVKGYIIV